MSIERMSWPHGEQWMESRTGQGEEKKPCGMLSIKRRCVYLVPGPCNARRHVQPHRDLSSAYLRPYLDRQPHHKPNPFRSRLYRFLGSFLLCPRCHISQLSSTVHTTPCDQARLPSNRSLVVKKHISVRIRGFETVKRELVIVAVPFEGGNNDAVEGEMPSRHPELFWCRIPHLPRPAMP
jgi:hypothetical protein